MLALTHANHTFTFIILPPTLRSARHTLEYGLWYKSTLSWHIYLYLLNIIYLLLVLLPTHTTMRTWRVLPSGTLSSSPSYAHIKYRTKWSNQWWVDVLWLTGAGLGGIMVMEWWTPYTLCSELRPARHGCHSARAVNGTPRNFTVRGEGPIYELLKLLSIAFNIDNLLRHYDKAVFKHSTARSAEVEPPRTWLKVR